jgi:hypothetical protein
VLEIDPVSHEIAWSYQDEMVNAFYTAFMGSAQRLWNGNTHITESATGACLSDAARRGGLGVHPALVWRVSRCRCTTHRPGALEHGVPDMALPGRATALAVPLSHSSSSRKIIMQIRRRQFAAWALGAPLLQQLSLASQAAAQPGLPRH